MPLSGKNDTGKAGEVGSIARTVDDNETLGAALTKAGLEPAKVGRKIVSQGKRRETLKKWASKDANK